MAFLAAMRFVGNRKPFIALYFMQSSFDILHVRIGHREIRQNLFHISMNSSH